MAGIKTESSRGRSPGPTAKRRESEHSELSIDTCNSPAPADMAGPPARTSKRRKRSELSPSSKATHSIIEKERREAMNEKFSELAANIPELVEAIASGKRPTKGEIVKASIARHQDQDRRVRELMLEVQMLRSGSTPGVTAAVAPTGAGSVQSYAVEAPGHLTAEPIMQPTAPAAQTLAMPYQIQTSHPIGSVPAAVQGNLWVGQLLNKAHEPLSLSLCHESHQQPPPLPLLPDMAQPVSPFKQTSMMNWNLSQTLDPAFGFASTGFNKGFIDIGTLEHLSRRDRSSTGTGPTPTSGFSSPTFTSSDSDSAFSADALDGNLDEKKFLADSIGFEPFALASTTTIGEQTPLTSLVGLPATTMTTAGELSGASGPAIKKARRATAVKRSRKDEVKEEPALTSVSPYSASLTANV